MRFNMVLFALVSLFMYFPEQVGKNLGIIYKAFYTTVMQ